MAENEAKSTEFLTKADTELLNEFVAFLNNSPSPYHAVLSMINELKKENFQCLDERNNWGVLKPGNYYFTRNQSTIVAFNVPENWKQGNGGFTVMGGHTDSPVFRVKPQSKKTKENVLCVGVEKYGGGLWHTWFDRDLSIAGRVMVKNSNNNTFKSELVRINRPILRIPTLAIHLNRGVNSDGFKFDQENETVPIFATEACAEFNKSVCNETKSPINNEHHPLLLNLIGKELNISPDNINDFELYLYDTQKSLIGGALNEFIFSARLDNLCSTFVILKSLINSIKESNQKQKRDKEDNNIRMIVSFDNEEIGSQSNRGAGSNLLLTTMKRINGINNNFEGCIQKSILISLDMAHAVHPNYGNHHENNHKPLMHKGLVVKYNCNQRYATNMLSSFHLFEVSKKYNLPLQKFVVKNTSPCGSTIGPILAAKCGIRTVDVGCPQLSMHSIREVCGVKDVVTSTELLTKYFQEFTKLDASLSADI